MHGSRVAGGMIYEMWTARDEGDVVVTCEAAEGGGTRHDSQTGIGKGYSGT
jgi:hypothetical protein